LWLQKRMRLAAMTSNLLRLHLREDLKSFHALKPALLKVALVPNISLSSSNCFSALVPVYSTLSQASAELFEKNSGDVLSACGLQVPRGRAAPCWMPERPAKISHVWPPLFQLEPINAIRHRPCIDPTTHLFYHYAASYFTFNHFPLTTSTWRWRMLRNGARSQNSANTCCLRLTAIRSYIPIHCHRIPAKRTTPLAKRQPIQPDTITFLSPCWRTYV